MPDDQMPPGGGERPAIRFAVADALRRERKTIAAAVSAALGTAVVLFGIYDRVHAWRVNEISGIVEKAVTAAVQPLKDEQAKQALALAVLQTRLDDMKAWRVSMSHGNGEASVAVGAGRGQ